VKQGGSVGRSSTVTRCSVLPSGAPAADATGMPARRGPRCGCWPDTPASATTMHRAAGTLETAARHDCRVADPLAADPRRCSPLPCVRKPPRQARRPGDPIGVSALADADRAEALCSAVARVADSVDGYVSRDRLDDVVDRLFLVEDSAGNVTLRVVDEKLVTLDLAESLDPRLRSAGSIRGRRSLRLSPRFRPTTGPSWVGSWSRRTPSPTASRSTGEAVLVDPRWAHGSARRT